MKTEPYKIGDLPYRRLLGPLDRAGEALARLDERLRRNQLAEGLQARSHFHESSATVTLSGQLVHMEDLVLHDTGLHHGKSMPEINRARSVLRARRQLADRKPNVILEDDALRELLGQRGVNREWAPTNRAFLYDPEHDEDALVENWMEVLHETGNLPPLLAAAIVWDAWLALDPVEFQGWRAGLIAAAILKSRGKTKYHLATLNWGGRDAGSRRDPQQSFGERIAVFLEWIEASANLGHKELDKLTLAHEVMSLKLKDRQKNSRMPELIDLMMTYPVITMPMVAKKLSLTVPGAQKMIAALSPRELTGRTRYRVWGIV